MSAFQSVYSAKAAKTVNTNEATPTSIFENVATKEKDVFAPSMNTKILARRDEKLTAEQIKSIEELGVKISVLNSSLGTPKTKGKDVMLKLRYHKLEDLLRRVRDPSGVAFVDKKKMFDVQPACAPGAEIVEWLMVNAKCMYRFEAKQMFQALIDHSYLIALNGGDDSSKAADEVDTFYTFQTDFFFPSRFWVGSDLDYSIFLLRRSSKTGGQNMLTKEEIERFTSVQKKFDTRWKAVVQGAEKQRIYLHSLDKREKRLYEFRECAFWRLQQCPVEKKLPIIQLRDEDETLAKKRMSMEESLTAFTPEQQAIALEKHVAYLQQQLNMVRSEVSISALNTIKFCDIITPLDPLLSNSTTNPWLKDESSSWPEQSNIDQKPSAEQAFMWCVSFRDMLADPQGVNFFFKFLERDIATENLEFYLAVTALDGIFARDEWYTAAQQIGIKFVAQNAPSEINIVASMRNAILEELKKSTPDTLNINVFTEAAEHTYTLMQKDSYRRFIATEEMKELQKGQFLIKRRFTASSTASGTMVESASKGNTIRSRASKSPEMDRRKNMSSDRYVPRSQTSQSSSVNNQSMMSSMSIESTSGGPGTISRIGTVSIVESEHSSEN